VRRLGLNLLRRQRRERTHGGEAGGPVGLAARLRCMQRRAQHSTGAGRARRSRVRRCDVVSASELEDRVDRG
jgi:hypothetical protein